MSASQPGVFSLQEFSDIGAPLVGGRLYTYAHGTTTFKTAYTDKAGVVAHSYTSDGIGGQYIALNARGELPAPLYLTSGSYDIALKTSTGASVWTRQADPIGQISDDLAATTGAGLIGWIRAATGAIAYTLGEFLGWQKPNVMEFMTVAQRIDYLTGAGALDVTAAIQAAENAATSAGRLLEFPGGCALITDTISRATGSQWIGEHRNQGLPSFINGTKIKFQPATPKDLWVPSGAPSLYRVGYCTEGFHVAGNSNARYCWDVYGINKSKFKDLSIDGFQVGMRMYGTIHNDLDNISITNSSTSAVLYNGGTCTTDTWGKTYIANAPIGIQTNGSCVAIRFRDLTMESITTYGVNIVKEAQLIVDELYTEDIGNGGSATSAAFRIGYDGTTLSGAPQLIVGKGVVGGRNAGGVGSAFDIDYTDGVQIGGGLHVTRFTNGIKTSANTSTNQVVSLGWTCSSVSNIVTDDTKISGFFPKAVFNGSSRNAQTHRFLGDQYSSPGGACTGAITTSSGWNLAKDGNVVTLNLPAVTGSASAAASFVFADVIPAKYRPSASKSFPCVIRNNGSDQATPGAIVIDYLTGSITVYRDGTQTANFTAGVSAGLTTGTGVSWTV